MHTKPHKTQHNKGLALLYTLAVLTLVAIALTLMTHSSNQISRQLSRQHAEANQRNLTASAITYCNINKDKLPNSTNKTPLSLNCSAFDTDKASLTIAQNPAAQTTFIITASCTKKSITCKKSRTLDLQSVNN